MLVAIARPRARPRLRLHRRRACSAHCGGLLAAVALFRSNFWLLAAGFMLIGVSAGFTQKIRFAAADASPSFYKPRAISWILAGGDRFRRARAADRHLHQGPVRAGACSPAPSSPSCRIVPVGRRARS